MSLAAVPAPARPPLHRRFVAAIGAACLALSALPALLATTDAHAADAGAADRVVVLDGHHTDAVSVRWEHGALVLKTRADLDSGAGQVLDPRDVLFHVTDSLKESVPDNPEFAFLGAPGDEIWQIPQSYQPGVLWAGWETESLPRQQFAGAVRLELTSFTGPGDLELYLYGTEGPRRILSSCDPALSTIHTNAGVHAHANWSFTAAGSYTLTFTAEAERVGGGTVRSVPQSFTFLVGGAPQSPPPGPGEEPTPTPTAPAGPPPAPADPPAPPAAPAPAAPAPAAPQPAAPAPTASAAGEQCIATPVTTEMSPENVDVVDSGHFDFGPAVEGGAMKALLKDDRTSPAPWIDPAAVVFHLSDAASAQAPGGEFAFLGSGRVWQIPLTQQSGVPWIGWNTQHPTIAGHAQGPVTLTLDGLEGPGDLAVYSVNSWGALGERHFGTLDGFPRSTSIEVGSSGVHVHGIWAFTEPGAYHATMTFAGTIDGSRQSGTAVLTFFIGEGDPRSAARAATVTTYAGRTASGAECDPNLAATGPVDAQLTTDLAGFAGTLLVVGLAFVGAAALAPRRTRRPSQTS